MKSLCVIVVLLAVIATCSAIYKNANLQKPPCTVPRCQQCENGRPRSCHKCTGGYETVKYKGIAGKKCRPWSRGELAGSTCFANNGGCDPTAGLCSVAKDGSVKCACKAGYTGDGKICTDIDECATNNTGCEVKCVNTPGSYHCGCDDFYYTDPANPLGCKEIDYCDPSPCDFMYGDCSMTAPGSASCTCIAGYTGDGVTCTPI